MTTTGGIYFLMVAARKTERKPWMDPDRILNENNNTLLLVVNPVPVLDGSGYQNGPDSVKN